MRAAILLLGAWLVVFPQEAQQEPKKETVPAEPEFKIPPEEAKRENPIKPTEATLAMARRTYSSQCAMCHGAKGDGKGDLAEVMELKLFDYRDPAALKDFTDGELFYILNKGKGKMPGQEGRMEPAQQWRLINFIRSLAKKPGAPPAKAKP